MSYPPFINGPAPAPEQHMIVVQSREAWAKQVTDGLDAIRAANGGQDPPQLRDGARIDRAAFSRVIEGLVALGATVDQELADLAGLKPVDQVI